MIKRNKKKGTSFLPKAPLYSDEDVRGCLGHFTTVDYHKKFTPIDNVSAVLYDAGHILGSSMVYLEIKKGSEKIRIAFSGDLGRPGLPIIRDPEILPPLDYIVLESTYGNRLHDPMDAALGKLADMINKVVDYYTGICHRENAGAYLSGIHVFGCYYALLSFTPV